MPKSILLDPDVLLQPGRIPLTDIEVNSYARTMEEERAVFSREEFLAIWEDMVAIRHFETILNEIKIKRTFQGVQYDHLGPAHLSIGQEASAVGMAFLLRPEDHIYGSHRSHGEILAKGFSAIRCLEEGALMRIMESYLGGAILRPLEKEHSGTVKELAWSFMLFGAYSEIFARETGFNRGLGGSMHAFSPPSASIRTMPLWAGRDPSPRAPPCSNGSTASPELWSATSATPASAAGRSGRESLSPAWTSTGTCGIRLWAAGCRFFSTA